jgi:hypothetical protein
MEGMNSMPSPDAKPAARVSTRVKALLILVGAVFFCCGAVPAAVLVRNVIQTLDGTKAAQQEADRFWSAISTLDFDTAYGMLDPETQSAISQREFTSGFFNSSVAKRDLYIPGQTAVEKAKNGGSIPGWVVSITGTIVDENDKTVAKSTSWYRYDGAEWKLLYFFLDN